MTSVCARVSDKGAHGESKREGGAGSDLTKPTMVTPIVVHMNWALRLVTVRALHCNIHEARLGHSRKRNFATSSVGTGTMGTFCSARIGRADITAFYTMAPVESTFQ